MDNLNTNSSQNTLFSFAESRQLIYLTASSNIIQINAVIIALVSWLAFLDSVNLYIKIACIFIISLNFISICFFMLALRPANYSSETSSQDEKLAHTARFYSAGWRFTAISFPLCLIVIVIHAFK